jgi:hypothetical protein
MKRFAIFFSIILICLAATTAAYGQKGCELNLIGTWKAETADTSNPVFYRFGPDNTVTLLSGRGAELREVASAAYTLDNPKSPKVILFKTAKATAGFAEGTTSMEIKAYDDTSLTFAFVKPGSEPTRWVKVDSNQYFIVLAGRKGTFYDGAGPSFPMLIKMDGRQIEVEAVGIYSRGGIRDFGRVPAETYSEFMKEPRNDSDVMLRLEITGAQYERGLKILRTWDRRAVERTLLYPDPFMSNLLLVKEVTESLNQCSEKIKLYKLDWKHDDHISDLKLPSRIPFLFFKEMRRLNESLHVRDEKFYGRGHEVQRPAGQ